MGGYGDFAFFYDTLQSDVDYNGIACYYSGLLEKFGGKKSLTLDLACGTGKITRLFSDFGYDMIATDASEAMLDMAVRASTGRNIQYLCQEMTELDMFGTLDNVICVFDGINHLSNTRGVRKAFSNVSLFMNRGGLFAFDVNTLYKHEKILGNNAFVFEGEDLYTVWQNYYDGEGMVEIELDFFKKEKDIYRRYNEVFSEKAYPLEVIESELECAGFSLLAKYDWLTENPPYAESEKVVFVAVKK